MTDPAEKIPERYFSLLIAWQDNDPEQGEFGWGGWAESHEQAELLARSQMIQESHDAYKWTDEELAEQDPKTYGGRVIDCVEGAYVYGAPEAARLMDTFFESFAAARNDPHYRAVMEALRPGWGERNPVHGEVA